MIYSRQHRRRLCFCHICSQLVVFPQLDCLTPVNHQRLCVLFSSSSAQSSNAPNPCVSPWYCPPLSLSSKHLPVDD